MVYDDHFLVHLDGTVVHFSHTDTAHVFIIIDGTDQDLRTCIRVSLGRRNVLDNGVKERRHITALNGELCACRTGLGGSVDEGAV